MNMKVCEKMFEFQDYAFNDAMHLYDSQWSMNELLDDFKKMEF